MYFFKAPLLITGYLVGGDQSSAKANNYCLIYKRIAVNLFSEDSTHLVANWLYSG